MQSQSQSQSQTHTKHSIVVCTRPVPPASASLLHPSLQAAAAQLSSAQLTEDAVGARLAPVLDDGLLLLRGRRRVGRHCCGSCCCCCLRSTAGAKSAARLARSLRCCAAVAHTDDDDAFRRRRPRAESLPPLEQLVAGTRMLLCRSRPREERGAKLRNEEGQKEGSRCREIVLRFLLSLCARPHAVC